MESLFPSSSSKKKHGFLASIMATNHPSSGTSEDDSEELSILGLVTSGEFSAVGQPAASGTCASVHQTLVEAEAAEATPCKAKLCLQSAQVGDAAASAQRTLPERFTTMDEVLASLDTDRKQVWEDPNFPAADSSLYYTDERPDYLPANIEWKRPSQLVKKPALITDGVTKFDVHQGHLGDCWFLASLSALATNPTLYSKVIGESQSFDRKAGYCGAFSFKFFVAGEWREVVVDDRLPTVKNRLLFLSSGDENEFWPALLEKAFAKLNGSYDGLSGGDFTEASSYFGAISESFNIRGPFFGGLDPKYVKARVVEAHNLGSLCGAAIFDMGPINSNSYSKYGLPSGHAYTLTGSEEDQVEVRNPWGEKTEWVGQTSAPDGEFWMEWDQFMVHFHQVQVAHYSLDSAAWQSPTTDKRWVGVDQKGSWSQDTAGGSPNYRTFPLNPQYQVKVGQEGGDPVMLLISIDQISTRRLACAEERYPIGFLIYKSQTGKRLSGSELKSTRWIADSGVYRYNKQVVGRYKVPPGTYTIIPTTYYPKTMGEFFLRVWHYEEDKDTVSLTLLPHATQDDCEPESSV